jgi:hypothetical protein
MRAMVQMRTVTGLRSDTSMIFIYGFHPYVKFLPYGASVLLPPNIWCLTSEDNYSLLCCLDDNV